MSSYGCATFIDLTISTYSESYAGDYSLTRVFIIFVRRAGRWLGAEHLQQPPDGDHEQRLGLVARRRAVGDRADPDPRARPAPVVQLRLHRAVQQLRLLRRQHVELRLLVRHRAVRLPADAVHDHRLRRLRAPVRGDRRRPRWRRPRASGGRSSTRRSVATSCCSAWCSPIPNATDGAPDNAGVGGGGVAYIFVQSLGHATGRRCVLFISASAQFFCATSCMTSASRMTFAFSRDGAIPGSAHWSKLTANRVPANAVMLVARRQRDRHAAGADQGQHRHRGRAADHPGRVLRRHVDRGHRALPRVRDPDLPALAARRQVRGRARGTTAASTSG